MATSPSLVYRSPLLYELFMMTLYGRHYSSRFRTVVDLIPPGASVVDLCCGPAVIYHHYLRHKSVRYTGIDINHKFIDRLIRHGGQGQVRNLQSDEPLPEADYVIMLSALMYFLPDPKPLVDRMLQAARRQVIISEPIRHLAKSRIPLVGWIARRSVNAGLGHTPKRFEEPTLDAFFSSYASSVNQYFLIPGGRDKVYVLNKESE